MPGPGDARCRQAAVHGRSDPRANARRAPHRGSRPDEPGPDEVAASAPGRRAAPGASGRELHTPTPNASHITQYAESEPRKNGHGSADRNSVRLIRKPASHGEHHDAPTHHGDLGEGNRHAQHQHHAPARSNGPAGAVPSADPRAGCRRSPDSPGAGSSVENSARRRTRTCRRGTPSGCGAATTSAASVDERGSRVGGPRREPDAQPAELACGLPCPPPQGPPFIRITPT